MCRLVSYCLQHANSVVYRGRGDKTRIRPSYTELVSLASHAAIFCHSRITQPAHQRRTPLVVVVEEVPDDPDRAVWSDECDAENDSEIHPVSTPDYSSQD